MLLQNKNAIIYGAGGSLGSTVAKAFAAAGASVFLSGRHLESVKKTADEIIASGGKATAAEVDAMDENAVNSFIAGVLEQAGTLDISFNLIDFQVIQNMPLADMQMADFVRPVAIAAQSHFLTDVAAARVMMKQGSGVVLSLTATPAGIGYPGVAGFGPACCAMECLSRNLASEAGQYGVRAVNIRSGGSPDSWVFKEAIETAPEEMKVVLGEMEGDTMLKKLPLMADIANLAVFLASDLASKITGVTVDITCGTTAGLNYKSTGLSGSADKKIQSLTT
jgi:NAD(P)-dependent dehydrogenase (short-subunit alcohol dehydrogenase family)